MPRHDHANRFAVEPMPWFEATVVSPHGLRATHNTLDMSLGISSVMMMEEMGHVSRRMTEEVYAAPDTIQRVRVTQVASLLSHRKKKERLNG